MGRNRQRLVGLEALAEVPVEHIAGGAFADSAPGSAAGSTEIELQAERLRRWLAGATAEDFDPDLGGGDS